MLIESIHSCEVEVIDSMPPSVDALGAGRSAPTMARSVGVAGEPDVGPAKKVLGLWLASVAVIVPLLVRGEPVSLKIEDGKVTPTDVRPPPPPPLVYP